VDVEGHELNVLRSVPFDRYRFRVVIVETHHQNEQGEFTWKHRDWDEIHALMAAHGYTPAYRNAVNTFYMRV
jgi:hypothetical protein